MSDNIQHYVLIGNKRYGYTMVPKSKGYTTINCKEAGLKLRVPNDQVPQVLGELAKQIIANRQQGEAQSEVLRFRTTPSERAAIEQSAMKEGYTNVSAYLRAKALGEE